MQYTIRTHTTRLTAAWQGITDALARWRLAQSQTRRCEVLDEHALRDLALDRSECGSYLAESSGKAESTRRRLAAAR
jgi:uncharacterized protein YjiS (DUF1127 family)